jgi:hypothetical protein
VPGKVQTHGPKRRVHEQVRSLGDAWVRAMGYPPIDQAGHMIARMFGAPDGLRSYDLPAAYFSQGALRGSFRFLRDANLVPQNGRTNLDWLKTENRWRDLLKAGTGIYVRIEDVHVRDRGQWDPRPRLRTARWEEMSPDGSRRSNSEKVIPFNSPMIA